MTWAPDYITSADLKAYMRITDTVDDLQLADAVTSASRAIDLYCGRQFGQLASAEARVYTPVWNGWRCAWVVDTDDFQDATGLTATVTAGALTVLGYAPANAVLKGYAFTQVVIDPNGTYKPLGKIDEVTVTAKWGWNAFPAAVKLAAKMQASRFHNRRDSPYGIAGSPEQGSEVRLLSRLDPDVAVELTPYKRPRKSQ